MSECEKNDPQEKKGVSLSQFILNNKQHCFQKTLLGESPYIIQNLLVMPRMKGPDYPIPRPFLRVMFAVRNLEG